MNEVFSSVNNNANSHRTVALESLRIDNADHYFCTNFLCIFFLLESNENISINITLFLLSEMFMIIIFSELKNNIFQGIELPHFTQQLRAL